MFVIVFFAVFYFTPAFLTAQTSKFTLEINNVSVNGGQVHVAIFFTAGEFKKEIPSVSFILESTGAVLNHDMELVQGEYLFTAFQDSNKNGECDFGFLGIPKELVALSNFSGRGIPSRDFNKLKVPVNNATGKISIRLHKF